MKLTKKLFFVFFLFQTLLFWSCNTQEFDKNKYLEQHQFYEEILFIPFHYQIKSELDRELKNRPYYDYSMQLNNLCDTFFLLSFIQGDFKKATEDFKKLKKRTLSIFEDKRLFLSSETDSLKKKLNQGLNAENYNQLFFNYIKLRSYCLSMLSSCTFSCSFSYKWHKIEIDTILTSENTKVLHIYDNFTVDDNFADSRIIELSRNGKSLLNSARLLKNSTSFSLMIPCDNDTGDITIKAELFKIVNTKVVRSYILEEKIINSH
jgi:hypothetical protein